MDWFPYDNGLRHERVKQRHVQRNDVESIHIHVHNQD